MSKNKSEVYYQRNLLVILIAIIIDRFTLSLNSGWGIDSNEDWEDEWRTVVYIELDTIRDHNGQICFHMDPETEELARHVLPEYEGEWDGEWFDTHKERIKKFINKFKG